MGAQSAFIMDIFDIGLDEGEGQLHFPSPMSGVERFATPAFLRWTIMAQDMANRMRREIQCLTSQIESKPIATVVGVLPGLPQLLLDLRRRLAGAVVRPAGLILQTILA